MILKDIIFTDDPLAFDILKSVSEAKIENKIVEEFSKTDEYQKIITSVDIGLDEVRNRVMEKLVDEIIENWRRNE